jgi:hypothetical protein
MLNEKQELMPIEQHTENGEQLKQMGLEEAEATCKGALVPVQVGQIDFYGDGLTVVLVEIDEERQCSFRSASSVSIWESTGPASIRGPNAMRFWHVR